MFNFAGADAVGQRAEGAVRGRVAVAADDCRAGQREIPVPGQPREQCPGVHRARQSIQCQNPRHFWPSVSI